MLTYKCRIQFSEDFSDQFKHKDIIDLPKAIEEFQLFPWDSEIKKYKTSNINSTVPKIIFDSNDQRQLSINAVSENGYNLEYMNFLANQYANVFISNDFYEQTLTTEEFIERFFNHTIELELKLDNISKDTKIFPLNNPNQKDIIFSFKPNLRPLISFNFFLWLIVSISYFIFSTNNTHEFSKLVNFCLLLTWPIPILLHLTYYFKNYKAKVIIDTNNKSLKYIKGSKEILFNRTEIFRCQLTTCKSSSLSLCNEYSYVWFILEDRTYILITCFIADPYKIVEALNCKFEENERIVPLLPI
jgi:hypothetical protein